jgi:hypothetical protein
MRRALAVLAIPALAACAPAEDPLDTPRWRATMYCNEAWVPWHLSACRRRPPVDAQIPPACIDFAAAHATVPARRDAYEILCRDGVIDAEGRSATGRSRLADRVEVAAQVAANTAENPARRARAAEAVAILRALYAQAPPE